MDKDVNDTHWGDTENDPLPNHKGVNSDNCEDSESPKVFYLTNQRHWKADLMPAYIKNLFKTQLDVKLEYD